MLVQIKCKFPHRIMEMPQQELDIIGQAIQFHKKRHNLKITSRDIPDVWFCEASNFTVVLRNCSKEIARYRYGVSGKYWFSPEQPTTEMPEGDLIRAAIVSHRRRCNRRGEVYQQPSPACCEVEEGVVILRNGYTELGRYRWIEGRGRFWFECVEEGAQ